MRTKSHWIWTLVWCGIITCALLRVCSVQKKDNYVFHYGPPTISVFFVPLDDVCIADIERLALEFEKNFAEKQWEPYIVTILEHSKVPDSCFNERHTRYSAKKVIEYLDSKYRNKAAELSGFTRSRIDYDYYIIGVTNKDIATNVHGYDDYGILGLSYLGGNHRSVIISRHRLSRKKDLWKLATHEFCHGFYGAPHCPNNDKHCIMCDAKGRNPHFEIKDSLCIDCANYCLIGD